MCKKTRIHKAVSVLLVFLFLFSPLGLCAYAEESGKKVWTGEIAASFAAGEGTESSPYQITTGEQLALFADIVNSHTESPTVFYAVLEDDIYLNEIDNWNDRWRTDTVFVASDLREWTPIAPTTGLQYIDITQHFGNINTVHFDGKNHTIHGLYIRNDSDQNGAYLGLFSIDASYESTYKNIIIDNSYIHGNTSGNIGNNKRGSGSVIGSSFAAVDNCVCLENVFVEGYHQVGGIAGYAAQISNCTNFGKIHGFYDVGGIVGRTRQTANSVNRGSVEGDHNIGGIAGQAESIQICYNSGAVSGNKKIGGLSGTASNVMQCYNLGSVSGTGIKPGSIGGIVGYGFANECYNAGSVKGAEYTDPVCATQLSENNSLVSTSLNCFYLDKSDLYGGKISSVAKALNDAVIKKEHTYTDWDFDNVWTIPHGAELPEYPQFIKDVVKPDSRDFKDKCDYVRVWKGDIADGFAEGDGKTEATAYKIKTAEQLAYLAKTVNEGTSYSGKYFKLENDIVLNNTTNPDNTALEHWTVYASEWTPIGLKCPGIVEIPFSGIFDGQGHFVKGLKTPCTNYCCGLFGFIENGAVRNLRVLDSYVYGDYGAGGICGRSLHSSFENCSFSGIVHGRQDVGGIVGTCEFGDVTNCSNHGSINAVYNSGGIAGVKTYGDIIQSYNTGRITGTFYSGGIAGSFSGSQHNRSVEQCFNSGYVYAISGSGGIAGSLVFDGVIQNCYNSGDVRCSFDKCGGIVGKSEKTENIAAAALRNCYNCGVVGAELSAAQADALHTSVETVMGKGYVGCIAGQPGESTIENCYYLENSLCQKGLGSSGESTVENNCTRLNLKQMQRQESFGGFSFGEGADSVWMMNAESAEFSNEYLFPQIKQLSHKPGYRYSFDYAQFKDDSRDDLEKASASPFTFSNAEDASFTQGSMAMDGTYAFLLSNLAASENHSFWSLFESGGLMWFGSVFGSLNGFCFGMSAVMMLHMMRMINVGDFQWNAKEPYDFLPPVKSKTVESLINFFQLYQSVIVANKPSSTVTPKLTSETLHKLIDELKKNNCVLLRLELEKKSLLSGRVRHYVVVYDKGRLNPVGDTEGNIGDSIGTVGIWDPNELQSVSELTVKITGKDEDGKNLYGFENYAVRNYDRITLVDIVSSGELRKACDVLKRNISSLNLEIRPDRQAARAPAKAQSARAAENNPVTTLISGYDSFTIKDSEGNTATIKDGAVQEPASLHIRNGSVYGENILLYQFILPDNNNAYTITHPASSSNTHAIALFSETENWYSLVDAENLESVTFVPGEQRVETSSGRDDAAQKVVSGFAPDESVDSTSWNRIELSGDTKGITTSMHETACSFTSASKTDITVKAGDGVNNASAEIDVAPNQETIVYEEPNTSGESGQKTRIMVCETDTSGVRAQGSGHQKQAAENHQDAVLGYTVFFISGTDQGNQSVSVDPGTTVKRPAAPEKPKDCDYSFLYWQYWDERESQWKEWNFKKNTVNSDVRLFAKWEKTSGDDKETCATVTASPSTGAVTGEGAVVTLSTATPGAQIYYTIDGTSPCIGDNPSRIHYAGPITLTENVQIIAYAVRDGRYDSEITVLDYTVKPNIYTVTWIADGKTTTETYEFGEAIIKPADPFKEGFTFKGWSSPVPATMPANNLTFTAIFEAIGLTIRNYAKNKTVGYLTTITFTAEVQNPVPGAEIHWIVGNQVMGTGDTYTAKNAKETFTVQVQYVKDDQILAKSEMETVTVRTSFLAKLIAFIRALLGRLPIVVQEYLRVEIIDRVLP